ncbi:MAG: heavy metal-binding domain-containing protein [Motilibacteraceae bacterium]
MSDWDGRGLPPAARARLQRASADGVRTSLLSVPGAVGVESVGLTPAGEVMGCLVQHIGWQGFGGCSGGGWGFGARTVTSGAGFRFAGYRPYVDALYRGYGTAIDRMAQEAHALGADGVVDVRITIEHLGNGNQEFLAMGTAVRAAGRARPARIFVTDLPGQDVAKVLHAGWVPVSIALGISVAVRHDDYRTQSQASGWSNTEVSGYTELVQHVRADARHQFDASARQSGADVALVSDIGLNIWETEPSDNHRDHHAECRVIGSTLAKFHRGRTAVTDSLTIMLLRPAPTSRRPR